MISLVQPCRLQVHPGLLTLAEPQTVCPPLLPPRPLPLPVTAQPPQLPFLPPIQPNLLPILPIQSLPALPQLLSPHYLTHLYALPEHL